MENEQKCSNGGFFSIGHPQNVPGRWVHVTYDETVHMEYFAGTYPRSFESGLKDQNLPMKVKTTESNF